MKFYFVRHGESEANVLRVISNRGWVHPLTEKGRQQAEALAETLQGTAIAKIYTSPLQRAVQTAESLSRRLDVDFEVANALGEFDCGIAEGRADPDAWQLHNQVWEDWAVRLQWDKRIEGGENFMDMQMRFVPFLAGLLSQHQSRSENLALIGHGALYCNMLPLALSNISRQWAGTQGFPNTGYVLAETGLHGLTCLEWCGIVP